MKVALYLHQALSLPIFLLQSPRLYRKTCSAPRSGWEWPPVTIGIGLACAGTRRPKVKQTGHACNHGMAQSTTRQDVQNVEPTCAHLVFLASRPLAREWPVVVERRRSRQATAQMVAHRRIMRASNPVQRPAKTPHTHTDTTPSGRTRPASTPAL